MQILPDGGHVSRCPEELLLAYRQIVMALDALPAMTAPVPAWLRSAHDRIGPMLRFFRLGDGGLALFNGGGEGDARMIAAPLARDEVKGQPSSRMRRTRAISVCRPGRLLAIIDCGAPPPGPFSTRAHAGCLAFELSSGANRIVVNCGGEKDASARWNGALRARPLRIRPSHLQILSTTPILAPGFARDLLGPRLLGVRRRYPETDRRETSNGWRVEASHGYYVPDFGIVHRREMTMSPRGTKLTGADHLLPDPARCSDAPCLSQYGFTFIPTSGFPPRSVAIFSSNCRTAMAGAFATAARLRSKKASMWGRGAQGGANSWCSRA